MKIIVDHLTRMAAGYICVAGLAEDGTHIRPVLEGKRLPSRLLVANGGPFEVGGTVDLGRVTAHGQAPDVEDHLFEPNDARRLGDADDRRLWAFLESGAELSLVDIFGQDLERKGKKAFVREGTGRASLGTLAPGYRPRLHIKERRPLLTVNDPTLGELELAVTDVRLHEEADQQWVCREELVHEMSGRLRDGQTCMLSVGLTSPFSAAGEPNVHWLQVNNIHFEPPQPADSTGSDDVQDPESSEIERVEVPPSADAEPKSDTEAESGPLAPRSNMWPNRLDAATPASEQKVWNALGTLPEQWHVFHGIRWQALRRGVQGDGEADFVLLHPAKGLIVLEAKGGGLHIEGGVWYTKGREGRYRINPIEQAQSSKHALLNYLRETINNLDWLSVGHAVWFTDIVVERDLGPDAPKAIILDRDDLDDPQGAIDGISSHWDLNRRLRPGDVEAIVDRLAPNRALRVTIADRIRDIEKQLVQLTESQARALNGLRHERRVLVLGGAGTGKTVVGIEKARRLNREGYRVALLCYNRALGANLERQFEDAERVDAGSFHRLARSWVLKSGLDWPANSDKAFWGDPVAELLLDAAPLLPERYDAIVVDEGQDFAPSWFMALEALLGDPDTGQMLVFADSHQMIYRDEWDAPYDSVTYRLDDNIRNTHPIATVVCTAIGDAVPIDGPVGPPVEFIEFDESINLPKRVGQIVHRLVREEGVLPESVAILTQRKEDQLELGRGQLAGLPPVDLGSKAKGILIETIHSFKGLEADAAILVLRDIGNDYERALAYIGTSRARASLTILAPANVGRELGLA